MWTTGAILIKGKVYKYQVKHYVEGSQFGIENGKISKLFVTREGEIVLTYERGWDVKPVDEDSELCLAVLMKKYN